MIIPFLGSFAEFWPVVEIENGLGWLIHRSMGVEVVGASAKAWLVQVIV